MAGKTKRTGNGPKAPAKLPVNPAAGMKPKGPMSPGIMPGTGGAVMPSIAAQIQARANRRK